MWICENGSRCVDSCDDCEHYIEVELVQHGEWMPTKTPSYFGGVIYECSLCGAKDGERSSILGKYCWRCGAKMDGGKK